MPPMIQSNLLIHFWSENVCNNVSQNSSSTMKNLPTSLSSFDGTTSAPAGLDGLHKPKVFGSGAHVLELRIHIGELSHLAVGFLAEVLEVPREREDPPPQNRKQ